MRVLIVHPSFYMYGGAELVIVRLSQYLTRHNVKVDILTSSMIYSVRRELRKNKDVRVIVPKSALVGDPFVELSDWIKSYYPEYDIINFHNHPAEIMLYPEKHKSVWNCNEPPLQLLYGAKPSAEYLEKVRTIDIVVVSDEMNRDRFLKLYGGDHDVRIVHYGVDYDYFSSGEKRKLPNLEDKFVVLHVGTIHDMKNQARSIEAIHRLRDKIPNIHLVLAGYITEPYIDKVKGLIDSLNLQDRVWITGSLPRDKLRDLYYSADVLLHPIKTQGGWLAPFEALSANLLPIVSPEAPCSSTLKKHNAGVVTRDYEDVIYKYYRDPDSFRDIVRNGHAFTREYMTWDRFGSEMLNIFRELERK